MKNEKIYNLNVDDGHVVATCAQDGGVRLRKWK